MKKIFITMLMAIVAISIFSCKKVELSFSPISSSDGKVIFHATIGDNQQTKTTFNDQSLKLSWSANDKVYIWHQAANGENGAGYNFKASAAGAETNLVQDGGNQLQWINGANTFSAIYVGNAEISQSVGSLTISLPAEQHQSQANNKDHFGHYMAMKGFLATTHSGTDPVENVDIHFSPLYSVLEFAFPYDDKIVTMVEARITSDEGDQVLAFETAKVSKDNNSLDITEPTTPSKTVTLDFDTPMDLSKGICKAWMIVKPGTYNSIKFTYTYEGGETHTKEFNSPITIARGTRYCITTYGNIVRNTADENDNTINNLENAIKAQLNTNDLSTITSLKVTGTMNQKDFTTLKNMSSLRALDLSEVRVVGTIKIRYNSTTKLYETQPGNAIPYTAFSGVSNLINIILPKSITTIGESAFEMCITWTGDLTIPEGVSIIGDRAFYDCSSLNGTLTIPKAVRTIGNRAFRECRFTGNLTIPEGVETIGYEAFRNCSFTGDLTIPSTVTTIDHDAFYGCSSLNGTLTIPSSVTSFGNYAFTGCTGLTSLSLNYTGELPTYKYSMFPTQFVGTGTGKKPVTVPEGCKSVYLRADGWKSLNIIQDNYESTDYNYDSTIKQLLTHSVGNGVKLVITGDGFADKDFVAPATGKSYFDRLVDIAVEEFFDEEPYKTFRNRFDVYSVAAVSKNDIIGNGAETIFGSVYGEGTHIQGNDLDVFEYAKKAVASSLISQTTILVILNDAKYAGTCWMYSSGAAIAYVPFINSDATDFGECLRHECGHGFGKLADEYFSTGSGTITAEEIEELETNHNNGWFMNVDVTSSTTDIIWSHFLQNDLYDGQVDIFEGARYYEHGVYRPTNQSIMNQNTGGFNAPSREVIYKRIMELSGETYSRENFIAYDVINRNAWSASTLSSISEKDKNFVPLAPPVIIEGSWRDATNNTKEKRPSIIHKR